MLLIDIRSTNASAAEFILYRLKLYLAGRHHHRLTTTVRHAALKSRIEKKQDTAAHIAPRSKQYWLHEAPPGPVPTRDQSPAESASGPSANAFAIVAIAE